MRLTLAVLLAFTWSIVADAQPLRIYHTDVDQADATLIVSPSGRTLLVDSGKNGHGPRLRAAMQTAGVTQILSRIEAGDRSASGELLPLLYDELRQLYRPSHADYTYFAKFGIRAWAGG